MANVKITISDLRKLVIEQSLIILKEGQASTRLHGQITQLDEFINVYQKQLDKTVSEESKALEKEEFVELKEAKTKQLEAVTQLIKLFSKKVEYLENLKSEITSDLGSIKNSGVGYFADKNINELSHDSIKKGEKLKLVSISSELVLQKIADHNQYNVLKSTASGIEIGNSITLPQLLKIGHPVDIKVYKKIGDKYEDVGNLKFSTLVDIIKNPS